EKFEKAEHIGAEAVVGRAAWHRADEEVVMAVELVHAHAVAEDGAARQRAGGIDRKDSDRAALREAALREAGDQAALARAGRAGDADAEGCARDRRRRAEDIL